MKVEIINSDIYFDENHDPSSVILTWLDKKNGIKTRKSFLYQDLKKNIVLFQAFKKHHPEFFL